MARALYLGARAAREILQDLARRGLIVNRSNPSDSYRYEAGGGRDALIGLLDKTYRSELIRLTRLIHSKPSASVREFARAFRLKKENE